jgi:hypothetical protein
MAYSDFSARDLIQTFGVQFKAAVLFADVRPIEPSAWLVEALSRGQELGFGSEKSRSERLVTPFLLELSNLNQHAFSIYSGMNLDMDRQAGLTGECDFIFSFSRIQDFVTAPVFCITEAKKQDLEQGTIQASAQLLGARKLNEQEANDIPTLYGCVTTGIEWRFLTNRGHEITLDEKRYLISDPARLLGVLQHIVDRARPHSN